MWIYNRIVMNWVIFTTKSHYLFRMFSCRGDTFCQTGSVVRGIHDTFFFSPVSYNIWYQVPMALYLKIFYRVNSIQSTDDQSRSGFCKHIYMSENWQSHFGGNELFQNWHNHSFYLVYDRHKKLHKISCTAVVRRKIQFGLCADLTCCQCSYIHHLGLCLKG